MIPVVSATAVVSLLLWLPWTQGTLVFAPAYNQGCNGNPHGTWTQFPPIGSTNRTLNGPTLLGGYLNPGVSGHQSASSGPATSSALQTAEYFMVGPHGPNGTATCYVPTATHAGVTASFTWAINWTAYVGANCTGTAASVASYDVFVVGNFHTATPPYYLITPVSPNSHVDSFVVGCGGPYSHTGSGTFTVTTPAVTVTAGTHYDFYTAIWVYTQTQVNVPANSTASGYAGVSWSASFSTATCTCP